MHLSLQAESGDSIFSPPQIWVYRSPYFFKLTLRAKSNSSQSIWPSFFPSEALSAAGLVALPFFAIIFVMDAKDKALKIALGTIAVLAVAMFSYYWFSWRNRTTQHDVNVQERVDSIKEEKSEYAGIYSSSEPIEGMERRLSFFTLTRKEDGSGHSGTLKLDRIASTEAVEDYLKCNDVNIGEKEFFIKCNSPELGQISFVGEQDKSSGALQVRGKVLWNKDGNVVIDKATILNHTGG